MTQPEPTSYDEKIDNAATIVDGRYKLLEKIGAGAMAVVYRGEHLATQRAVAIKILSQSGDDKAHARFKQEATAILGIRHPNIVAAYDFGTLPNGDSFLVMDLIEGTTLEKLIDAHTAIDTNEMIMIALQIASGLREAHRCGILHRDLKPSNIMLVGLPGSFFVKIVDFGLAKPVSGDEELRLTNSGQLLGTPLYMSPEQCAGLEIDQRSDLYSFGCVLYELFTGQAPFLGENALRVIYMHVNDKPKNLKDFPKANQNVALETIILKLLEKDKTKRFQSATELLTALEDAQEKPGALKLFWLFCNAHAKTRAFKWTAASIVTLVLTLVAVRHFTTIDRHETRQNSPGVTEKIETTVPTSLQNAEAEKPELVWINADLSAQQAVNRGDYEKAGTFYEESRKLAKSIGSQYELATAEGLSDLAALTGKDTAIFATEINRLSKESVDSAAIIQALKNVHDKETAQSLIDEAMRLATILEYSGRYSESEKMLTAALATDEKWLPNGDLTRASLNLAMAEVLRLNTTSNDASAEIDRRMKAYALLDKHQDDELYQQCVYRIGRYYNVHEQPKMALPFLKKALAAATRLNGPQSKQVARCCNHLAICYSDMHQQTLANATAHEALTIMQSLKPEQLDADAFYLLAQLEQYFRRDTEALRDFQRSLLEYERGPSKNYPLITDCFSSMSNLIPLYRPEREYLLKRRLVILKRIGLLTPTTAAETYFYLSAGYQKTHNLEKQREALQKAVVGGYKCTPHSIGRKFSLKSANLLAEADLDAGDLRAAEKNAVLLKTWLLLEVPSDDPLVSTANTLLKRISAAKQRQTNAEQEATVKN